MAKEKVRLRYQPQTDEGTTGDAKPAVPDIYVSEQQAAVYRKNGWREVTEDEIAAEQAEQAGAGDSEGSAAPDADEKPAAGRGRGKGAATAADEKEA